MLKVIYASLISAVICKETQIESWNMSGSNTKVSGIATETFLQDGDDKSVQFQIDWKITSTKGGDWRAGWWIQTYAMWEDFENPGKYAGVTCNAEYRDADYSSQVKVDNFLNSDTLTL